MAYTDWSTTPGSNTTIDGVNIAEGCPPGNVNNGLRSIMAGVAELRDDLPDFDTLMPKAGGVFSGTQPVYTGRGAYMHHASSSFASGRISFLPDGSANPSSPASGDVVFFYAP
jgi:hypothetical protein